MHLSQKQKKYAQFFCPVLQSTLNFAHFQEKMTLVAYVFPKLRTPKLVVREISTVNMVNGLQNCLNFNERTFTILIDQ